MCFFLCYYRFNEVSNALEKKLPSGADAMADPLASDKDWICGICQHFLAVDCVTIHYPGGEHLRTQKIEAYCRSCIETWMERCKKDGRPFRSPTTNIVITKDCLVVEYSLVKQVARLRNPMDSFETQLKVKAPSTLDRTEKVEAENDDSEGMRFFSLFLISIGIIDHCFNMLFPEGSSPVDLEEDVQDDNKRADEAADEHHSEDSEDESEEVQPPKRSKGKRNRRRDEVDI